MKITKFYFLLFTAVSLSFAAKAQTTDDIIGKYVDAIGGKDKISQIKSVYTEATVSVIRAWMAPHQQRSWWVKGYRSEIEVNSTKVIQVVTDSKRMDSINPYAGASRPYSDARRRVPGQQGPDMAGRLAAELQGKWIYCRVAAERRQ